MVPVLNGVLERQFWLHAAKLSSAIHTLLSMSVSIDDLPATHKLLQEFVQDMNSLYGLVKHRMYFQMHCLLSLEDFVF